MRVKLALAGVAAAMTALAACGSPSAHGRESVAEAAIAAFEKNVPLPDASRTLGGYERYYAVSADRIEAVYLLSRRGAGRIHRVERRELPQVKDGGCAVVNIVLERAANRFARILCNPVRLTERAPKIELELPGMPASGGERG
jgi:hypothetical protein